MHVEQSLSSSVFDRPASQQQDVTTKGILALLLRLRPHSYATAAVRFDNTFYLGLMSALLLGIEILTGLLLLFFYTPHPDFSGQLVSALAGNPLLAGVRDLHRLAAELLMVTGLLHLLRVVLCGAYKGPRRFTWVGGLGMLFCLCLMTLSGYILIHDLGALVSLREISEVFAAAGLPVTAADGGTLLKMCYLIHVLILPVMTLALFALHYHRVHWVHGISLPVCSTARRSLEDRRLIAFWPTVALFEFRLLLGWSLWLVLVAAFFYDAPLETEANLPWFALWLQGLLTIFPQPFWGLAATAVGLALLGLLPWIERRQRRPLGQRPGLLWGLVLLSALVVLLSLLGEIFG
jgi:quinol-cytochrome oxidoreductase complex cytochrome b subunit